MAIDSDDLPWALQEASAKGHLENVQGLFEKLSVVRGQSTAFEDDIDRCFESALCKAVSHRHCAIASYFLDQHVQITTAVMGAAKEGYNLAEEDIVRWHLENGADPNIRSRRGYTALESAAYQHPLSVVKFLVDHGAQLHNTTALHRAAVDSIKFGGVVHPDRHEVMNFLLDHGANIDQLEPEVNPEGDEHFPRQVNCYTGTPLHRAVESEDPENVRFLLQRGADQSIKGAIGQTPLQVAENLHLNEIAEILRDW